MTPDILLVAINAKYVHPSLGARYLLANLGELRSRAVLVEFDLRAPAGEIVANLLARSPRIVGLGVYVWNVELANEVLERLKAEDPGVTCIVGGPEVSHETEDQRICSLADYVVRGEGEVTFAELCREVLQGNRPAERVRAAPLPDLDRLTLPYDLYQEEDLAHRLVYVETSRGCPFRCEYCLSSLDPCVRTWPLDACLAAFDDLLDRGARRFKFVDRTFNLSFDRCAAVMDFFLARHRPGLEVHFEMVPSRFPAELRERLRAFPPGSLRLEIGVQTFNPEVARRIQRPQDNTRIEETFLFLRDETHARVHADLIAGLPGEDMDSFGAGFDRLLALGPREIQVGLLKRLRGVPIVRHDAAFGMVYDDAPPYPLVRNRDLGADEVLSMDRFARYWERIANRHRFARALPLLWGDGRSPFEAFMAFSDWLYLRAGRTHALSLDAVTEGLLDYLVDGAGVSDVRALEALQADYCDNGRRRCPPFLLDRMRGLSGR